MPPLLLVGTGTWRRVGAEAKRLGGRKALIVSGQAMIKAGFMPRCERSWRPRGWKVSSSIR